MTLETKPPRQSGWVLSAEDWALTRRWSRTDVTRELGVDRSTKAQALASDRPPKYTRASVETAFTPFEPLVRQLPATTPDMRPRRSPSESAGPGRPGPGGAASRTESGAGPTPDAPGGAPGPGPRPRPASGAGTTPAGATAAPTPPDPHPRNTAARYARSAPTDRQPRSPTSPRPTPRALPGTPAPALSAPAT